MSAVPAAALPAQPELLGVRAYARHLGVSHPAVVKAIKSGRIAAAVHAGDDGKPLIQVELADALWKEATDPSKHLAIRRLPPVTTPGLPPVTARRLPPMTMPRLAPAAPTPQPDERRAALPQQGHFAGIEPAPEPPEAEASPGAGANVVDLFRAHQAERERLRAHREQLDLGERMGALLRRDQVERQAFHIARTLRDALADLRDRIAPELAATADVERVDAILAREFTEIMEKVPDACSRG